jgi:site-specific DNA-methyltransferase (adenine-specific)
MVEKVTIGNAELWRGDCLEMMASIPDGSIDMILCDLPYGTTACKWDTVIPFEPLWAQYRRIAKRNAAIVLTASQPFTTALIASNMREFAYCWVWDKVNRPTGFMSAKLRPLKATEDVCVFYAAQPTYNPQKWQGEPYKAKGGKRHAGHVYGLESKQSVTDCADGMRYPQNIIRIKADNRGIEGRVHPTQKPVALMEYLIRTYTQEGETVLDNCMGSGTTGVACANTGRRFIGIERERKYFDIACERIEREQQQARLAL